MSYFSQPKNERAGANANNNVVEARAAANPPPAQDIVSTIAPGMLITGNVVCSGAVQIYGRVIGDIHVARLLICKGAYVEGKITALDAAIDGTFNGTVHSNTVKLQATAVVEGEIFNKSLSIEQNALFEGMSRRLTTPVEAPSAEKIKGVQPAVALVPDAIGHADGAQFAAANDQA